MGLTDSEAAWLACAIDSEGSITYSESEQRRLDRKRPSRRVVACVHVTNDDPRYIAYAESLISRIAGGCNRGVRVHKKGRPTMYVSVSSQPRVRVVLEQVLPYLIVKRHRAQVLIAYFDERSMAMQVRPKGKRGSAPFGAELDRLRSNFYTDDASINPRRIIRGN